MPGGAVLIVEDNPDIREVLRELLEDEKTYTVLEAVDGLEGLSILRASAGALVVLLDYAMPVMNGFEMLSVVEGDAPLLARLAFILVTANDDYLPDDFVQLLHDTHTPIIGKPFEADDLLAAVAAARRALPLAASPASDPPDAGDIAGTGALG